MAGTIDMQLMRYINLFARITRVPTTKCFVYNNQIVFGVPKAQVSIAIGKGAVNVKKLNSILGKKIRVVAMPGVDTFSNEEIGKFVEAVVSPVEFNKIEVRENSIVINAGRQNKAALIGRGRQREKELSEVLKNFFKITKLRIV
ncbi:KH domain-containing protein [Candidatus Pacearchaeota archaeon]|nr:KH domain-containing protein [Candidatus Pacearchaeota archaeon]